MKDVKVLIPLLSKLENNPVFLDRACEGAKEIIVLAVIDRSLMVGQFGFCASEMMAANDVMEEMRKAIGQKRKTCNDIVEWGDTLQKTVNIAKIHSVDKIFLARQDNKYFEEIAGGLERELGKKKIEIVEIREVQPEK